MLRSSYNIGKSRLMFFLGLLLFLAVAVVWLQQQRQQSDQLNRQLIIQNDSILSVNILLKDSVRKQQATLPVDPIAPAGVGHTK